MKKLLILAYDFPPYVSVGGLRPWSWYKYLKQYGVHPVVVTRQWAYRNGNQLDYVAPGSSDNTETEETEFGTLIRTPYKPNLANRLMLKYGDKRFVLLRKIITAWYEFMQYPLFIGPKSYLYFGARDYIKKNKVNAIIATGDPFVLFKYASALSEEFKIPWIADYRDPWSANILLPWQYLWRVWSRYFEKKYLSTVGQIITVSEFVREKVASVMPGHQFQIIENGYDPQITETATETDQFNDVLSIAFAGSIYEWNPLEIFLKEMNEILNGNPKIRIRINFYGTNAEDRIKSIVSECIALQPNVNIYSRIPNDKLLPILAKHNVLLLFNYYSFMGTKIFDYLGLKRIILFCFSNDPEAMKLKGKYYLIEESDHHSRQLQEDLIRKTNSGIILRTKEGLKGAINKLHEEFEENRRIVCNSHGIEKYARNKQVERLAKIVKGLSD